MTRPWIHHLDHHQAQVTSHFLPRRPIVSRHPFSAIIRCKMANKKAIIKIHFSWFLLFLSYNIFEIVVYFCIYFQNMSTTASETAASSGDADDSHYASPKANKRLSFKHPSRKTSTFGNSDCWQDCCYEIISDLYQAFHFETLCNLYKWFNLSLFPSLSCPLLLKFFNAKTFLRVLVWSDWKNCVRWNESGKWSSNGRCRHPFTLNLSLHAERKRVVCNNDRSSYLPFFLDCCRYAHVTFIDTCFYCSLSLFSLYLFSLHFCLCKLLQLKILNFVVSIYSTTGVLLPFSCIKDYIQLITYALL